MIVEDEKGTVDRVSISCWDKIFGSQKDAEAYFVVGRRFSLLSPYYKIAGDGQPCLKVENAKSIVLSDVGAQPVQCCYCCGKEAVNDQIKACSRCGVALYCSEECQKLDWLTLDHKVICDALASTKK